MALKTVIASGNWSNPGIWSPSPPVDGDDVLHGSDFTVYLDVSTPNLGDYNLQGNLLILPPDASEVREFKVTSGSFTGSLDVKWDNPSDEMGEIKIVNLGGSPLNFSTLNNLLSSYSTLFAGSFHGNLWLTQFYPTVTGVGTSGGVVVVSVNALQGSAAERYLTAKNGQTVDALVLLKWADAEGQQRRFLYTATTATISGTTITLNDIPASEAGRVVTYVPLVFLHQTKLCPVVLSQVNAGDRLLRGVVLAGGQVEKLDASISVNGAFREGENVILHVGGSPAQNLPPLSVKGTLFNIPLSASNYNTISPVNASVNAEKVINYSSDLPLRLSAREVTMLYNITLCLFRENSHWEISDILEGEFLWERPSKAYVNINSTPSSGKISVTNERMLRWDYNDGTDLIKLSIISSSYELKIYGTVSFLGETFDKCEVKILSPDSEGGVSIPLPFKKEFVGFGVVSLPSGGTIGLVGKNGVFTSGTGQWLVSERGDTEYILRVQGSANDVFVLANLVEWDRGSPPTYVKVISDQYSSTIYKFILSKVNNLYNITYEFGKPKYKFVTFRFRTSPDATLEIMDGIISRGIFSSVEYKWITFRPYSNNLSFIFSTQGTVEIDIEALNKDFYPNYDRGYTQLSSVKSVVSVVPDPNTLPNEGYIVKIHPTPTQLQSHYSKLNYIRKGLQREGIGISFDLDENINLARYIRDILVETLTAATPISVYITNNTIHVWIVCATQEQQAQALGDTVRTVKNILSLLSVLNPEFANYSVEVHPIHRR